MEGGWFFSLASTRQYTTAVTKNGVLFFYFSFFLVSRQPFLSRSGSVDWRYEDCTRAKEAGKQTDVRYILPDLFYVPVCGLNCHDLPIPCLSARVHTYDKVTRYMCTNERPVYHAAGKGEYRPLNFSKSQLASFH